MALMRLPIAGNQKQSDFHRPFSVGAVAAKVFLLMTVHAQATIDNTVVVTGTPIGGVPGSVTASDTESVDVQDAAPQLTIVKSANLNDEINADGLAEVGETTTYTYQVTNTGNVTLTSVAVQDIHEGVLLTPLPGNETITVPGPNATTDVGTPNDGVVDVMDVGAEVTFSITLTVTQQEVDGQ